jgi:hypothetical protein
MDRSLPADAAALPLASAMVEGCLDLDQVADRVFARAWRESLTALSPAERRGAPAGVTGHVAESVVELLLADLGYQLLWHFTGPGRHGVDLIVLCPAGERVVAVEVKGTLRPRYWPRLSRRELVQMSGAWVDKVDNPGMANWDLRAEDVYGSVVLVNFAAMAFRAAFTADFQQLQPVRDLEQLGDLRWLGQPQSTTHPSSS